MLRRLSIEVSGIVQGVGFRPHVYRLAKQMHLVGSVNNNSRGVRIEVQGEEVNAEDFVRHLKAEPPPLAQIVDIKVSDIPPRKQIGFHIVRSVRLEAPTALISPDIAVCEECLRELFDPQDRRYRYPFINCTNCGPRFTIVADIPYDRVKTSMAGFAMCERCQKEYDDPEDRRFHAQPNACPECGPRLFFCGPDGTEISGDPISLAVDALKRGKIVAIKGLGGFHLAVDATNDRAVKKLRERKHRFEKPLALMVANVKAAKAIARVSEEEASQLLSPRRPIVLCRKKEDAHISASVSPDNDFFGMMLPYSPLHALLFEETDLDFLVMTSANLSEEPICFRNGECLDRMAGVADYVLAHNRDILGRCDDSVVKMFERFPLFLRRSRGFAPEPILLNQRGPCVLAVGGHQKNAVCLTRDNFAFLSQHVGDLENLDTLRAFEEAIGRMQKLFEIFPQYIIHDAHPDYLSTRWAREQRIPAFGVQHHYAHILSVMAESGIEDTVIGIALDGAGYGLDGHIWGGEVLVCSPEKFDRFAHLEYIPMPGAEQAVKQPWRMALSHLLHSLDNGTEVAHRLFREKEKHIGVVAEMCRKKINSPLTSSCGRLFDAVAALIGLKDTVSYEGQAAIMLEALAAKCRGSARVDIGRFEFVEENEIIRIDARRVIQRIAEHALNREAASLIARAFHEALIALFARVAQRAYEKTGLTTVVLSGGCFQNGILLCGLSQRLKNSGFTVGVNRKVPVNDGGLALGQAYWGLCNAATAASGPESGSNPCGT
jgi:hydrogenase maturation protein HypF